MQEAIFEEALELIQEKDPRYHRDAYRFVREALDHTQTTLPKPTARKHGKHVSGQELLAGIRDYAMQQFGPMAMLVLEHWGIRNCQDFGEIVFNMVESGGPPAFAVGDFLDLASFLAKLREPVDPLSRFLWERLSEPTRRAAMTVRKSKLFEPVLVRELNEIIRGGSLYDPDRFAAVALTDGTRVLLGQNLRGIRLAQLNRSLLEEAYPQEIARSHGLLAKTEEDSRADFAGGYDFFEAFRKPFLPPSKQGNTEGAFTLSSNN
jgi:uncharacterized repeat protein (TIGR04138 family)